MKRRLSLLCLAMILSAIMVPVSLVLAESAATDTSDQPVLLKENTPVTIHFSEKGEISEVVYGLPDGFKVEVLKDSEPVIDSTGMHNRSFDLWDTNRSWRDTGHTAHYLNYGDRQAAWCSWTPDESVGAFVGVYNVAGDYAVGLINPSANNVIVTVGSAGDYRPQAIYYGSRQYSSPVHFLYNYYPWW